MSNEELTARFEEAARRVKEGDIEFEASNQDKLEMYALFKQATEGDVTGDKPVALDMVGRAKYKAWQDLEGMTAEDAMKAYIDLIEG